MEIAKNSNNLFILDFQVSIHFQLRIVQNDCSNCPIILKYCHNNENRNILTFLFLKIAYQMYIFFEFNPTSPLGDRWFRPCVSTSIPQLLHPILYTVLEEGFSPPPTSSPGLWTGVVFALVTTYIQFFAILAIIIFSSFFKPPFISIFAPFWLPTWCPNRSKIH